MRRLISVCLLLSFIDLNGCTPIMAHANGPGNVDQPNYDRRWSQSISDLEIHNTASIDLYNADARFHDANVTITVFYGTVLLTGQVPAQDMKEIAGKVANKVSGVVHVYNQLKVGAVDYYLTKADNTLLATRIRSRLMFDQDVPYSRLKIVVDDGVVYIMGKVSKAEAHKATERISDLKNIRKIVLMIDYINDNQSANSNKPAT